MNDNAKKWANALDSGEYKQGDKVLRHGDTFCCLGVACDLAIKAGLPIEAVDYGEGDLDSDWGYKTPRSDDGEGTRNDMFYLPPIVAEWLGLDGLHGKFQDATRITGSHSLAEMNDRGDSFGTIAAKIREEPNGLFKENE